MDLPKSARLSADKPYRPSGRRRLCAAQAFPPQAETLAQGEFISPEHLERPRVPRQTCLLGIRQEEMRTLGTVQLPTEAFMAVLKLDEE